MLASMRSSETANIRGTTETSSPTYGGQAIGYSRLVLPSQRRKPDDGAVDLRRFPRDPHRTAHLGWHDATRQRDVRRPVARQRIGHRARMQVRQAQPVHLACSVQQLRCRHDQPREHGLGAAEEQRRPDPARKRQPAAQRRKHSSTSASIRSATVSVACGRLAGAWLGMPASRRSSQMCRTAASVSASKTNSTECTIVSHTKLATHAGSNADALIASNSAALIDPAPAGSTARSGASAASASRLPSRPDPGSRGPRADHQSCARNTLGGKRFQASARCGSACPVPAATTTSTGAARSSATSRSVDPSVTELDEQAARRPRPASARPGASDRRAPTPTSSARVGSARPARRAAATGASGSGYRHAPRRSVTPDSRRDLGRGRRRRRRLPVCTGLHTATSMPASRA